MKYLKKDTVRTVIELADASLSNQAPNREKEMKRTDLYVRMISTFGSKRTWPEYFVRYVSTLSDSEMAELITLRLLGKDSACKPDSWDVLVEKALSRITQLRENFSYDRLPQYLRLGMERLARHLSKKDHTGPLKVVEPQPESNRDRNEERWMIAGRYTVEAFIQKYGPDGMRKLGEVLESKGYLQKKDERQLFGLPVKKEEDLESILGEARSIV